MSGRLSSGNLPSFVPFQESPFKDTIMKGKVILVSGGGTGIGFGIAHQFGMHGASVAIMGRRKAVLDEAVDKMKADGITCIGLAGDVRDEKKCNQVRSRGAVFFFRPPRSG